MKFQKVNVNDFVKVKLKPEGLQILRDHHERVFKHRLDKFPFTSRIDEDGYYKMQIWEFMQHFGSEISLGRPAPFETDVMIQIEE